jgi:hypothetical protein
LDLGLNLGLELGFLDGWRLSEPCLTAATPPCNNHHHHALSEGSILFVSCHCCRRGVSAFRSNGVAKAIAEETSLSRKCKQYILGLIQNSFSMLCSAKILKIMVEWKAHSECWGFSLQFRYFVDVKSFDIGLSTGQNHEFIPTKP